MSKHNQKIENFRNCSCCGKRFNAIYEEYGVLAASPFIRRCASCRDYKGEIEKTQEEAFGAPT